MNGWEILSKYNYCYPIQINYWNMKIVKKTWYSYRWMNYKFCDI